MPEVLTAAAELAEEGVGVVVIDVTSATRLTRGWRSSLRAGVRGAGGRGPSHLDVLFGADKSPVVTVHDAASHSLAWVGSALGVPVVPLGVDSFGQSGSIDELYKANDLDAGSIVNAALLALTL